MFSEPVITFIKSESLFAFTISLDNNAIHLYTVFIGYCNIKTNIDIKFKSSFKSSHILLFVHMNIIDPYFDPGFEIKHILEQILS